MMETMSVSASAELKRSKTIMLYSIILYMGFCVLSLFLSSLSDFIRILMILSLVSFIFGIYKFSKLTRSVVFRYCFICVILQATYFYLDPIYRHDVLLSVIITIVFFILQTYVFYRISAEMDNITFLSHFSIAFRLYIVSIMSVAIILFIFCALAKGDNMVEKIINVSNAGISNYQIYQTYNANIFISFSLSMIAVLFMLLFSCIFFARGIAKINCVNIKTISSKPSENGQIITL